MQRQTVIVLVIVAVIVVAALGWWWSRLSTPEPTPAVVETPAPAPAPAPEAPAEPPLPVPGLADSDEFALGLASDLGLSELLAAGPGEWIIRTFVRAVDTVASGELPTRPLAFLAPAGDYLVVDREGRFYPDDPGSYRRYDRVSEAVAALDARTVIRAFERAEPLTDEAFVELGGSPNGFRMRLVTALDLLLAAPVPDSAPELLDVAVDRFEYADAGLEALMPVQKQMLRLGPDNQRRVQAKLEELRGLLGPGTQ